MVKLVQIHQTRNMSKMQNMFMNKVQGSLRLGSLMIQLEI